MMKLITDQPYSTMSEEEAIRLACGLNKNIDGDLYVAVPTAQVGKYAIACYATVEGKVSEYLGLV